MYQPVLKTAEPRGSVGSNPTLSASYPFVLAIYSPRACVPGNTSDVPGTYADGAWIHLSLRLSECRKWAATIPKVSYAVFGGAPSFGSRASKRISGMRIARRQQGEGRHSLSKVMPLS